MKEVSIHHVDTFPTKETPRCYLSLWYITNTTSVLIPFLGDTQAFYQLININ
jgi:hypothetical protein